MSESKYLNYVKKDALNKVDALYEKEAGCVSKAAPGSLVLAKRGVDWVVSFGWNCKDSMVFDEDTVLKEVVKMLLEKGFVFYHNEDMIVYVNKDAKGLYKRYREKMRVDEVLKPEQAAEVLGWSNEKLKLESVRAQTMV